MIKSGQLSLARQTPQPTAPQKMKQLMIARAREFTHR